MELGGSESGGELLNSCFKFNRIAFNPDQLETMGLPARPTNKKSDSRSKNIGHDISFEVAALTLD